MSEPDTQGRIRALIVDDEPPARDRIRRLLAAEEDFEIAGEYGEATGALAGIRTHSPDVVFLDVRMPGLDGVSLVESMADDAPYIVFASAYESYAVRAFDLHAVDYLLKPFDPDRFRDALERVRAAVRAGRAGHERGQAGDALRALVDSLRLETPRYLERLAVRSGERVLLLRADSIDHIEAEGNYVRIHAGAGAYLVRETMTAMEAKLDPTRFVRIHRSTIVNMDRIRELRPLFHGDYAVLLHDGTRLSLSRGYRSRLQDRWGGVL